MPKVAFHTNLKTTPEAAEIKTHNRCPDIPNIPAVILFRDALAANGANPKIRPTPEQEKARSTAAPDPVPHTPPDVE
jgi:hypothetical protein